MIRYYCEQLFPNAMLFRILSLVLLMPTWAEMPTTCGVDSPGSETASLLQTKQKIEELKVEEGWKGPCAEKEEPGCNATPRCTWNSGTCEDKKCGKKTQAECDVTDGCKWKGAKEKCVSDEKKKGPKSKENWASKCSIKQQEDCETDGLCEWDGDRCVPDRDGEKKSGPKKGGGKRDDEKSAPKKPAQEKGGGSEKASLLEELKIEEGWKGPCAEKEEPGCNATPRCTWNSGTCEDKKCGKKTQAECDETDGCKWKGAKEKCVSDEKKKGPKSKENWASKCSIKQQEDCETDGLCE